MRERKGNIGYTHRKRKAEDVWEKLNKKKEENARKRGKLYKRRKLRDSERGKDPSGWKEWKIREWLLGVRRKGKKRKWRRRVKQLKQRYKGVKKKKIGERKNKWRRKKVNEWEGLNMKRKMKGRDKRRKIRKLKWRAWKENESGEEVGEK